MLPKPVLDAVDEWWARDFVCTPAELRPSEVAVQEHAGELAGAPGIWILLVGEFPRISLPPTAMSVLGRRARDWSKSLVLDPAALGREIRPLEVEKIIGPAFIGYGTADTLDLASAVRATEQTLPDAPALARLRATCTGEEWEHGGSHFEKAPTFRIGYGSSEVAALAGYEIWDGKIAHISVVTAPEARGRSLATSVVALAAQHALAHGLIPQYRTLLSNQPSLAVARRLGFEKYGLSVYVRLALPRPP